MSAEQFSEFMQAQIEAIEQACAADVSMSPEQWIAQYSEQFRNEWEQSHHA